MAAVSSWDFGPEQASEISHLSSMSLAATRSPDSWRLPIWSRPGSPTPSVSTCQTPVIS
jgi:hypothetical protein